MKASTLIKLACAALMTVTLAGCATNPTTGERELTEGGKAVLKEVAAIGVERWARETPSVASKAAKVRAVLAELQATEEITTVEAIKKTMQARIDEKVSDPYERADFTRLLNVLAPLLSEYVGTGELDGAAVVKVRDFFGYLAAALPHPRTSWSRFDFSGEAAATNARFAIEIAQLTGLRT